MKMHCSYGVLTEKWRKKKSFIPKKRILQDHINEIPLYIERTKSLTSSESVVKNYQR